MINALCFVMEESKILFISSSVTIKDVESVLHKWHSTYDHPPYIYVLQEYVDCHFPSMWHQKMPCLLTTDMRHIKQFECALPERATCSICMLEMRSAMTLQCDHQFHRQCIRRWVFAKGKRATCPLCRSPIIHS